MSKNSRIRRKIEKIYRRREHNIYSQRFYQDLFCGYAYSLRGNMLGKKDFFRIVSDNTNVEKIFSNSNHYNFFNELEETIDSALYSLAVYGKAYVYVKPEYTEIENENGKVNKELCSLSISEVKGVLKKESFYYKTYQNEISKFDIGEGTLIVLDLKELGYRRNYFTRLVKKIGKYDAVSVSYQLLNKEPSYDFNAHVKKSQKRFLKNVSNIGWRSGNEDLSESYILYKEIKMRLFKMKNLQYVLGKINKVVVENYINDNSFEIKADTKNIDYKEVWEKYQEGKFTISDLNKIL